MIVSKYSLLQIQMLLLRQKMEQQRIVIQQKTEQRESSQFPRSLCMKLLQQHLSIVFPWLMMLKNRLQGKESALFWSVAITLGQHWLQRKNKKAE